MVCEKGKEGEAPGWIEKIKAMELSLLQDILVLLGFSVAIVFLLQRFNLPSILGFLLTGIIIGPFGLGLIRAVEQVETISEIGVIMLLFVIGMEMSIKQLMSIRKTVFLGGFIQVGLSIALTAVIFHFLDRTWAESVFMGFLFSLSSTAIVLSILQDRNEISLPHGRNALALLIFQDIIVVPMMLLTPIMAGQSSNLTMSILSLLFKTVLVLAITYILARYVVPRLLHAIALTRSKELFLVATITICFAVAYLTAATGLSLALGAFLAGLIISESEYSHEATGIILPFKELFTSLFFISVGMLLNISFFFNHILWVLLIAFAVLVLKSITGFIAIAVLGYPPKTVLLTGFSLFQVGEFAFILSKIGIEYDLLSEQTNQYFLAVSIITMLLTPFVLMYADRLSDGILRFAFLRRLMQGRDDAVKDMPSLDANAVYENHLIIIGYGINGRNLAKAADFSNIPYIVIEFNAATVKEEKANGVPIIFGNAAHENLLHSVRLAKARAVVVAISDAEATKKVIRSVRAISHSVYLLVRTRYVKQISELLALGADAVIPEEFETSIEIFSRILHEFLIPEGDIAYIKEIIRASNYELLEQEKKLPRTFKSSHIPDFDITCLRVNKDSGKVLGTPLNKLDLRNACGVTVLAISRNGEMLKDVKPTDVLKQGDLVYINGSTESIEKFHDMLN